MLFSKPDMVHITEYRDRKWWRSVNAHVVLPSSAVVWLVKCKVLVVDTRPVRPHSEAKKSKSKRGAFPLSESLTWSTFPPVGFSPTGSQVKVDAMAVLYSCRNDMIRFKFEEKRGQHEGDVRLGSFSTSAVVTVMRGDPIDKTSFVLHITWPYSRSFFFPLPIQLVGPPVTHHAPRFMRTYHVMGRNLLMHCLDTTSLSHMWTSWMHQFHRMFNIQIFLQSPSNSHFCRRNVHIYTPSLFNSLWLGFLTSKWMTHSINPLPRFLNWDWKQVGSPTLNWCPVMLL